MGFKKLYEGEAIHEVLRDESEELRRSSAKESRHRRATFDKAQHFTCEVALVADHTFFAAHGNSEQLVFDALVDHLNNVRSIYR